ncbi:hypothetical protein ACQP3J_32395, partial [Escherichia coli]
ICISKTSPHFEQEFQRMGGAGLRSSEEGVSQEERRANTKTRGYMGCQWQSFSVGGGGQQDREDQMWDGQ